MVAGTMKEPDYQELKSFIRDITAIPAVLYFWPPVLGQLNELCASRGLSPAGLISKAIESQDARFDEFIEELMTPLEPDEPEPEDPLYILACVLTIHLFRVLHRKLNDPAAFGELKKRAPAQWSFASLEDEPDEADWWKS
jgi:hypothetical protein